MLSTAALVALLVAAPPPSHRSGGDAVDLAPLAAVDVRLAPPPSTSGHEGIPAGAALDLRRFAVEVPVGLGPEQAGTWERLADGGRLWRLRLRSPGATNVSLALAPFDLPAGARLWLYDPDQRTVLGPYTRADRSARGRFYSPLVEGDEVVLELQLPRTPKSSPRASRAAFRIASLHHGFRDPGVFVEKQGSCNVDVRCDLAEPWRNQVRAVATTALAGQLSCSGTLVNSTANDLRPLFLTAEHCGINAGNADTLVVYWNYESARCGDLGGGSRAQTQSGARWLMTHRSTDVTLVELTHAPDPAFGTYWSGWDASGTRPAGGAGISHPSFEEKAIAVDNDTLTDSDNPAAPTGQLTHWRVGAWEQGTVEPGSSGSCFFDRSGRCVGILSAGTASCSNRSGFDVYGKLALAWSGGGTPQTSLAPWLDPLGTGARVVDGAEPIDEEEPRPPPVIEPGEPGPCGGAGLCLLDGRYDVTLTWRNQHNGTSGAATPVPFTDFSGSFWFTDARNLEVIVKLLDFDGVIKLFYGQLTDLRFELVVRETTTGGTRRYGNGPGECGDLDPDAFPRTTVWLPTDGASVVQKSGCVASAERLCLLDRFALSVTWRNPYSSDSGIGHGEALSEFAGRFDYGDPRNVELLVKVLDFGNRFLLLYGALSDFEYTLRVEDTATGAVREFTNPGGHYCGGLVPDLLAPP